MGVKQGALCWQESATAGNAACTFDCVNVTALNGTVFYPVVWPQLRATFWGKVRTDQDTHRVATFSSAILRARHLVQVSHCLLVPAHRRRHLYRQTHRLVEDWYTTLEQKQRCSWVSWRSFYEV